MRNLRKVTIDVYDEDGCLCESVTGPMDYEDVREKMIEIIKNDGVPVARIKGTEPRHVKCDQSERIDAKQIDEHLRAIRATKEPLIVHAAFQVNGVTHQVIGPAGWVKRQIGEALRLAAGKI